MEETTLTRQFMLVSVDMKPKQLSGGDVNMATKLTDFS